MNKPLPKGETDYVKKTKSGQNPKGVKATSLIRCYERVLAKLSYAESELKQWSRDAMIQGAKAYVNTIALYTPPHMGKKPPTKKTPQGKKLFNRLVYYLPQQVKNSRNKNKAKDLAELKKGNLFKINKVQEKKVIRTKYFKKKNRRTKEEATIHMRYLTKASWGANLDQIQGAKLPPNIKAVLSRNKHVKNMAKKLNKIQFFLDRHSVGVRIINNSNTDKGGWFAIADKKATKVAQDKQRRLLKRIEKQGLKLVA